MLLKTVQLALTGRNIKRLLTRPENHFKSNQICFILTLVKSVSCQSFRQNYFLSELKLADLREKAS